MKPRSFSQYFLLGRYRMATLSPTPPPGPCSITATIIEQLKRRGSYLTSTEVMAILRINRATLCRYCRASLIPHVRMTAQKIANRNKFIGNAAKTVGLGYEATKFAHDLLGGK